MFSIQAILRLSTLGGCALLIFGCAATDFALYGIYEDNGEVLSGTIHSQNATEANPITLKSEKTGAQCGGEERNFERGSGLSYVGVRAYGGIACSDGRTITYDIVQTGTEGHGIGIDNEGRIIKFLFAMNASAAKAQAELHRLNALAR